MMERITLHFVDGDTRSRAEFARAAYALGHHAEVYADLDELIVRPPASGIVIARDDQGAAIPLGDGQARHASGAERIMQRLEAAGVWLPFVPASEHAGIERVIEAMRIGAFDYLPLPVDERSLAAAVTRMARDAQDHMTARRRKIEARTRIANLSTREREVLDWLAMGSSNKAIARALDISPRTVEIHRANMMEKLGASHSIEAVRLWLEADLDVPRVMEQAA